MLVNLRSASSISCGARAMFASFNRTAPLAYAASWEASKIFRSVCHENLRFRRQCSRRSISAQSPATPVHVRVLVETNSPCKPEIGNTNFEALAERLESDAVKLVEFALEAPRIRPLDVAFSSKPHELSLVLCDDEYIAAVNLEWRGKNQPTDVLSFEIPNDEFCADLPVVTLGDIIISVDTAHRQALQRRCLYGESYSMYDEIRVLLVHGLLHLLGYDHELGPEAAQVMTDQESRLIKLLGWKGAGLIEAVNSEAPSSSTSTQSDSSPGIPGDIRLICLDMDGTLLNSSSELSSYTTRVLKQCLELQHLKVMLATGKARPAAIAACHKSGLAGPTGLVHTDGSGVFLQGLATYCPDGNLLPGPSLSMYIVKGCFEFSESEGVSLCAFLGDTCVTTKMTPVLEELHTRYYEPLAEEGHKDSWDRAKLLIFGYSGLTMVKSLEEILTGPSVKKLLYMSSEAEIASKVQPHIQAYLEGSEAESTQAVDTMLEVVPKGTYIMSGDSEVAFRGINKWVGISQYLTEANLRPEHVLAMGDGMNDYEMLANAGTAVAMENAKQPLIEIADHVTLSNDEHGVATFLEKYILECTPTTKSE